MKILKDNLQLKFLYGRIDIVILTKKGYGIMTEQICMICDACCIHCQIQVSQLRSQIESIASYEARYLANKIITFLGDYDHGFKIYFANERKTDENDCCAYDVKVICKNKATTIKDVKISSKYCKMYQRFKFFDELTEYMREAGYNFKDDPICLAVDFHHLFEDFPKAKSTEEKVS